MSPMGKIVPSGEPVGADDKRGSGFPSITRADQARELQPKLESIASSSGLRPPVGEGAHPTPGQIDRIRTLDSDRVIHEDVYGSSHGELLHPTSLPSGLRPHLKEVDKAVRDGKIDVSSEIGRDSTYPGPPTYPYRNSTPISRAEAIERSVAGENMLGFRGHMGTLDSVEHMTMLDDGPYPAPGDPLSQRALGRQMQKRFGPDPVEGRQPTDRLAELRVEALEEAREAGRVVTTANRELRESNEMHRRAIVESRHIASELFERDPERFGSMPAKEFVALLAEYSKDRDDLSTIEEVHIADESAQVRQIERILSEYGPDAGVMEVLEALSQQADIPDMPQHQTFENFIAKVLENKKQAIELAKAKARQMKADMASKYGGQSPADTSVAEPLDEADDLHYDDRGYN